MSKNIINLFLIVIICLVSVWNTTAFAVEVPEVKPDKALIVFYRVKKFGGGAVPIGVHHASGMVGNLKNGTSFYKYFDPGEHIFWSKVIIEDSITLAVEAGETYYIKGETKMGLVVARPKLIQTFGIDSK